MRRGVVLHLLAWCEVVLTGPLLRHHANLVTPTKCREARIADLDALGVQLLDDPHAIALAAHVQLADALEVRREDFVAVERGDLRDAATQDLADCSAREIQDPGDRADAVALVGQAQDRGSGVEVQHRSSPLVRNGGAAPGSSPRRAAMQRLAACVRAR
jgi:hypothetical protein